MTPDGLSLGLDPRNTFDSYIVGTANRLAAAAAKRVAEAPGAAYNPLFLYSESGLGKTHLIMAIGNHIHRVHDDIEVVYDTLEHLMEGVMEAIQAGERDAFRARLRGASVLLLDDVQFLAGRRGAQEELLRSWDALTARGGQVVLASDRPPAEIDGLDQRLLSRFSGGLMADLSVPDYETRVAIARHKAKGNTVPKLRACFHVGSCYEFHQSEGLNPTLYHYIVGDVTVELDAAGAPVQPTQATARSLALWTRLDIGESFAARGSRHGRRCQFRGCPVAAGAAGAPAECVDEYPYDDGYTCAEQATWGKCDEVWLQGYCQLSCDRCGEDPDETSGEDFGGRRDVFTEFSAKQPLAPTPPMGWNSWNKFGCDIDEALVREIADAMVSSGMRDVGYEYVNIDDCWQARQRDADGNAEGLSAAACESVSGARKLKHQKRPPAPG